jgi:pantoate--beta-alanine ligase
MRVIETSAQLKAARSEWRRPVGFVPTMGYLHQGHVSLIARARAECSTVVVSIFVNPTQFGPTEDLAAYPRDLPRDLQLCEETGVDVVFVPAFPEMYPPGHRTYVEVEGLQERWEGAARPGHFRGVATVVALLFRIIRPDRAYFGEKDYQQLQIVRRLSRDLHLDVEVLGCPTIREPDGLACSSRNVYLTGEDRKRAAVLFRALQAAQERLAQGERDAAALGKTMGRLIAETAGTELDYAVVVDSDTLEPLHSVDREARALVAASIAGVHLIDNASLIPPARA